MADSEQVIGIQQRTADDDDNSAYIAAVSAMNSLPKISPPVPIVMPTLRPTPPVVKIERKRPLPLEVQFSMFEFEESTARQNICIHEQKDFTAITVSALQHFVTTSDHNVEANEEAGRDIVLRAYDRELMCIREDFIAGRHMVLSKALERIQSEGEKAYVEALHIIEAIEEEELAAFSHLYHWEKSHRPAGVWAASSTMLTYLAASPSARASVRNSNNGSPLRAFTLTVSNGVLIPTPPSSSSSSAMLATYPNPSSSKNGILDGDSPTRAIAFSSTNPYKLTGQLRFQEEQQRLYEDKRRAMVRRDCVADETVERMGIAEDESRAFMGLESRHVEEMFSITHKAKADEANALREEERKRASQKGIFSAEFTPVYDTEKRYNAAVKIQTRARINSAKRVLSEKIQERDAHVELLVKQDVARQSLLLDPLPPSPTNINKAESFDRRRSSIKFAANEKSANDDPSSSDPFAATDNADDHTDNYKGTSEPQSQPSNASAQPRRKSSVAFNENHQIVPASPPPTEQQLPPLPTTTTSAEEATAIATVASEKPTEDSSPSLQSNNRAVAPPPQKAVAANANNTEDNIAGKPFGALQLLFESLPAPSGEGGQGKEYFQALNLLKESLPAETVSTAAAEDIPAPATAAAATTSIVSGDAEKSTTANSNSMEKTHLDKVKVEEKKEKSPAQLTQEEIKAIIDEYVVASSSTKGCGEGQSDDKPANAVRGGHKLAMSQQTERVPLRYLDILVGSVATSEGKLTLKNKKNSKKEEGENRPEGEKEGEEPSSPAEAEAEAVPVEEEHLPAPWKALLQLAVACGSHVDTIATVLAAYDAMPPEETMLEAIVAKREAALREAYIQRLPFCFALLASPLMWNTVAHRYVAGRRAKEDGEGVASSSSSYQPPMRWVGYVGGEAEVKDEEATHLLAREEENREGIIMRQIEEILRLKKQCDAVLTMAAENVPAAYTYTPAPPSNTNEQLVATSVPEDETPPAPTDDRVLAKKSGEAEEEEL